MLVVRIELWSAITGKKSEIGRMYIANDGGGTRERGNYKVAVNKKGKTDSPKGDWSTDNPNITRVGSVMDYPRLAYNVWRLVSRALRSAFPEEK